MQVQDRIDREVKVWSLLRAALRHWRIILVLSLAFAVLGALFYERSFKKDLTAAEEARALQLSALETAGVEIPGKVVDDLSEEKPSGSGEGSESEKEAASALASIDKDLSNLNLQNVEALIAEVEAKGLISVRDLMTSLEVVNRSMDGMRAYMSDSLKMKIDPYAAMQGIGELYVDAEDGGEMSLEVRNHILARYRRALISQLDYDTVAAELGCDTKYIRELVNVSVDYDAGVVRFSAYHSDKDSIVKIISSLAAQLRNAKGGIETDYGPHKLNVIEGEVVKVYNSDLVSFAANAWKNYYTMESTVNSYKKRVTETLRALAAGDDTGLVDIDSLEQTLTPLPKHSKGKLAVYGAGGYVLGCLALTFLFMLVIFLRGRIVDGNDLAGHGVRTLTELSAKRKGKALRGLDALLDRIGRTKDFTGTDEERLALAAGFVNEYGDGAKKLLLTGDVSLKALAALAKKLSANGVLPELVCQTGLFTNPKTVESLKDCDGIVLVEEPLKSSYRLAVQDVLVAVDWEKPVIGAIYL